MARIECANRHARWKACTYALARAILPMTALARQRTLKWLVVAYAVLACVMATLVSLYFLGFLVHALVPTHLGHSTPTTSGLAVWINLSLLLAWGVQHSLMARAGFKQVVLRRLLVPMERSTYVLASSVMLALMLWFWQPLAGMVWQIDVLSLRAVIWTLFASGLALVLYSSTLTDGLDLLGWRQASCFAAGLSYQAPPFTQQSLYGFVRHPMMVGALLAIWATPEMTWTHFMFSVGLTVYILVGIHLEEASMQRTLGDDYRAYQQRTSRLLPGVY